MNSRLASFLQIRPGEGRLIGLLIALFLVTNIGGAIGAPGMEALFYARFGVEFLPIMYMILGGTTMVVSLILTGLLGRLSKKRLYQALPVFLALSLLVSRIFVGLDLNWFYPILWLWMFLLWTLQSLFSWGLAGLVCDTRQAKRLFPLFGAGGILGFALGGLATPPLVAVLGAENLLLVWGAALLAAFGLVFALLGSVPEKRRPPWYAPPALKEEIRKGFNYVRRTELMRWIAVGAVLFSVLYFSLAFPFSKAVAAQFPQENDLASFLGVFNGVKAVVEFLTSLLVANRIYARFGFVSAIFVFPVIYFLGFGVLLVNAVFVTLVAFRFLQMAWLHGVADTAYQALFNIVPEGSREQTRTFINGVPQQIGVILTGLLLALGSRVLADQTLFAIGMGAAVITGYSVWRAGRAYRSALVEALRAGRPQVFLSEEEPFGGFQQDARAVETVMAGIKDPNPAIRQVSAEILGNLKLPAAVDALLATLEDPDPGVRAAVLHGLARAGAASALLEVAASLEDPSPDVRLEAVAALSRLASHPRGIRMHLSALLDDPDPHVRAKTALVLLPSGAQTAAFETLHRMAQSRGTAARVAALEAFGEWKDPSIYAAASAALGDSKPAVRKAAAAALSNFDDPQCRELLVKSLADPNGSVRASIAAALGKIGQPALSPVVAALQDPALEPGALMALRHLPVMSAAAALQRYTRQKVDQSRHYGGLWRDIAPHAPRHTRVGLLAEALRSRARRHAVCALLGIGLLDDPEAMQITIENLNSRYPSQRANALEMLDILPERESIQPVLYLWEQAPPSRGEPSLNGSLPLEQSLLKILAEPDEWLCTCAVLAAHGINDSRIHNELSRLAETAPGPLLAETLQYIISGVDMDTLSTIPLMERILYLQKVPLFENLGPEDLKQIAATSGEHFFPDGETIAIQGEPGDEMYIIVKGEIGVVAQTEQGEQREIVVRSPGDYVGEMSIISHEPRLASLVARGDVRVLCVEQKTFEGILRERPEVSLTVMRELISRLRENLP